MEEQLEMSENDNEATTFDSNEFSHKTNSLEFKSRHHYDIHTTTIYLLRPPRSLTYPFITAAVNGTLRHHLHHPLTTTPHLHHHLPPHFNLLKLRPTVLSVSHHTPSSFDKLLVVPTPTPNFSNTNYFKYNQIYDNIDLHECVLFALYDGGQLRGCPSYTVDWIKLSGGATGSVDLFDDVIICKGKIYAVDRGGRLYLIYTKYKSRKIRVDKTLIDHPIGLGSGQGGWRKRFVIDGNQMYLVVRVEEGLFDIYKLVSRKDVDNFNWDKVDGFYDGQVLFMARDYYFFLELRDDDYYGRGLENCIVFSEGAFPRYGNGCWELSRFGNVRRSEDDIAVFRLSDGCFSREGENGEFPRINWSPPPWIFDVWSRFMAKSQPRASSESYFQSKREPEEQHKGLDSNSKDQSKSNGQMQSDLIGHDKEQGGIESCSESLHQNGKLHRSKHLLDPLE